MSSTARFRRHFVPWDRPWLPQAATWLAGGWTGPEPLDLSEVLAVVPTRQAGRRLREALAEHAHRSGAAVFAPRTKTPDTLLADGAAVPGVATRLASLLAWVDVLLAVDLATLPEVFPVEPAQRDFPWAWRLAEVFVRLQTQLTEGGLSFADVAERTGPELPESERWQQLAALEAQQIDRLAALGKREPHAVRRGFARAPELPAGIARVVVLMVPDPLPLAVELLERWAEHVPVDVVVFAPGDEAGAFDPVGRPLAAAWTRRPLALPDIARHVHLCAEPAEEAERAARIAQAYRPEVDGLLALGAANAEVLPILENELSRADIASYNPEGRARRDESLHALLTALGAFAREPGFEAMAAFARCPEFLLCLRARCGRDFSAAKFLTQLDASRTHRLPPDLSAVQALLDPKWGELKRALEVFVEVRRVFADGSFPDNALAVLAFVFGDRRFDLDNPEASRLADAIAAWRDVLRDCASVAKAFPDLPRTAWWDVALRLFGETRRTEEKPAGALELQGWLELPWEDAPHLVVTGMNDGFVPDAIVGDAFLPESLRERLGLKTNDARFARDAYLLQALAASRQQGGRLDLLFAKTSAAGDPLRPSRLLLRCADTELPARIELLFRAADATRPNLPWRRAWKLVPQRRPQLERVAVTGLRAWLACPFRFYLQHGLKMEAVDPAKSELDARDFGTLCHAALQAMAENLDLRDCSDEKTLREFLLDAFDRAARERHGDQLTLPLIVQLESARQRLSRVAALQAQERAAGWVVERAEWAFALRAGGLEVRGRIDRIDKHETTGVRRVLDYKTSDTAVPPVKSHLRPARTDDAALPAWMQVEVDGRDYVWADLQLPIYLLALAADPEGQGPAECGYVNLPKAAGETALALWPGMTPDLLESARRCLDGVAGAIRAGEFWPPVELAADRDHFATLFHHGAADSVAWKVAP